MLYNFVIQLRTPQIGGMQEYDNHSKLRLKILWKFCCNIAPICEGHLSELEFEYILVANKILEKVLVLDFGNISLYILNQLIRVPVHCERSGDTEKY